MFFDKNIFWKCFYYYFIEVSLSGGQKVSFMCKIVLYNARKMQIPPKNSERHKVQKIKSAPKYLKNVSRFSLCFMIAGESKILFPSYKCKTKCGTGTVGKL